MSKGLSLQQQKVFDFLVSEVAAGRTFPYATLIAKHMGWGHASSATNCLDALANKAAIVRKPTATGWRFELHSQAEGVKS